MIINFKKTKGYISGEIVKTYSGMSGVTLGYDVKVSDYDIIFVAASDVL